MTVTPSLRKFALTVHLTFSVGWIGAVVAYLALVVAAKNSQEVQLLRAAWIAMELIGWYVIVPFALASLFTGLIMSLATPWGLFRHYWVLISFVLTSVATVVLLRHMQTVSFFASVAAETDSADVGRLRGGLKGELLHAGVGLLVLLVIEVLNVYKPRGMTRRGRHLQAAPGDFNAATSVASSRRLTISTPRWVRVSGVIVFVLVLLFAVLHFTGGGHIRH